MDFKVSAQTNLNKHYRRNGGYGALIKMDTGEGEVKVKSPARVEKENEIKNVCLNCKKKRCTGSDECFRAERDKRK